MLEKIISNIGDYTKDAILITQAEPFEKPGPRIVWCNQAFLDQTGYSRDEVIGQTPRLLQGPGTSMATTASIGKQLRDWKTVRAELLNYKKDGSTFWVELSIVPVADEKGLFRYWVSVQRDITARKAAEEDVESIKNKLQKTVEILHESQAASQTGTWNFDLIENKIYWSPELFRIFDLPVTEFAPGFETQHALFDDDSWDFVQSLVKKAAEEGEPYDAELTLRRVTADGKPRFAQARCTPISNDKGEIIRLTGTFQETTNTVLARIERDQALDRYEAALLGTSVEIYDWDLISNDLYWSPRFKQSLGLSEDEQPTFDIFCSVLHPKDLRRVLRAIERHRFEGQSYSIDFRIKFGDGKYRWIHAEGVAASDDDGSVIRMAGSMVDITDRIHREEELRASQEQADRANRAKSDFLANMSHELRTPLNSIIGYSEMMLLGIKGPIDSVYHEYLQNILDSGQILLDHISRILDLSKIEAGRMELQRDRVSLSDLLQKTVEVLRPQIERNTVTMRVEAIDIPTLKIDSNLTKDVLLNIISNAIKFAPNGTITISGQKQGDFFVLNITDDGLGMTEDQLAHAKQPFQQVHKSALQGHYGGTGLGLTIADKVMEMHGGHLDISSKPRQGTSVSICFPVSASF